MYSDDVLNEIRNRINIVDVVSRYVNLKKSGKNYQGLCPFHSEKTPSFFVNPNLGIYKCFGCGAGGDVFKFLQEIEKITFPEAIEKLAKEAGVTLPRDPNSDRIYRERLRLKQVLKIYTGFFHKIIFTKLGKQALDYLTHKRNLSLDFIKKFQLGYAPPDVGIILNFAKLMNISESELVKTGILTEDKKPRFRHRVMFPLIDNTGNIIGFSGRTLSNSPNVPKYLNTPETDIFKKRFNLFGLYWAKKSISDKNMAIITEGQMDVLSSIKAGITNIVAPLGTALTETQLILLKRFSSNVAFAFDNDNAGKKALERGVILALKQGLIPYVIKFPKSVKDIDELIQKDPEVWQKLSEHPQDFFDYVFKTLQNLVKNKIHYTDLEIAINKVLSIIVYAPEMRVELLVKELANAVGLKQEILQQKIEQIKKQIHQINKYNYADTEDHPFPSSIKHEGATKISSERSKTINSNKIIENIEADSSLLSLRVRANNMERYITLLILHYPVLVLAYRFGSVWEDYIYIPEYRALVKHIVKFMTSTFCKEYGCHNNKSKHEQKEYNFILEAYEYFVRDYAEKFSSHIKAKVVNTAYYDSFLTLATSEPPFHAFGKEAIKDFYNIWNKLQQSWLKIRISEIMEQLDKLESAERLGKDSFNGNNNDEYGSEKPAGTIKLEEVHKDQKKTKKQSRSAKSKYLTKELLRKSISVHKLKQQELEHELEHLTALLSEIEAQM